MTATAPISGQDLLDDLKIELGGLSNAFTVDQQLIFLNQGKDEVWSVIRSLDLDYFADSSQDVTTTDDDYFVDLSTTIREYNLPNNCREIRAIECTTPNYTDRVFEYHRFDDPDFMAARRAATSAGIAITSGTYFYTLFGTQLMFSDFPEAALALKIWYIKSIGELTVSSIPEILYPFNRKIVDFAAKKAVLSARNLEMAAAWKMEWMDSVKTLALTAGSRNSTNAIFISDFCG